MTRGSVRPEAARRVVTRSAVCLAALALMPGALVGAQGGKNDSTSNSKGTQKAAYAWKLDSARRAGVLLKQGAELQQLGFAKWSIPEYHDEQRFPVWDANSASASNRRGDLSKATFGPVVNIYASPSLDDFTQDWQLIEHGERGLLVAVVFVDDSGPTPLPESYARLHLRRGMNCLWLSHPTPDAWNGSISRDSVGTCARGLPAGMYAPLTVRRPQSGGPVTDYPPVARFSESVEGHPLLGVKCLNGWCEFGTNTEPWTVASISVATTMPVRQIRGWYDEQWLAQSDNTGVLRPLMYAAVFPAKNVATHKLKEYEDDQVPAGVVFLSNDPPAGSKYAHWGLHKGVNKLFIQLRNNQWSMIVGDGKTPVTLNAHRMLHLDAGVPATARWRYVSLDDGMWFPCGQACCRADEDR